MQDFTVGLIALKTVKVISLPGRRKRINMNGVNNSKDVNTSSFANWILVVENQFQTGFRFYSPS